MKIEVPPLGFTEGTISNLGFDLMLSISMAVLAYVLALQGFGSKYENWLGLGAALCVLACAWFFKNFLHVLKAVFGSVTITIESETCTISRRLFKWVRHVSYSTGDISQARVDTGSPSDPDYQGGLGKYRDLSIELFQGTGQDFNLSRRDIPACPQFYVLLGFFVQIFACPRFCFFHVDCHDKLSFEKRFNQ